MTMKTVPDTAFSVNLNEYKLVINLLEMAIETAKRRDTRATLASIKEARDIIAQWPQSSLAGHLFKRLDTIAKIIEAK
jgi:hypothetical protein